VTEQGVPIYIIEAKLKDSSITKGLVYLKTKFPNARATLVYLMGKNDFVNSAGIEHIPAYKYLSSLYG